MTRPLILLALLLPLGCHSGPPPRRAETTPDDSPPAAADAPETPAEPAAPAPSGEPDAPEGPRATALVDELVQTLEAAFAGQELPQTTLLDLRGARAEQVVRVQGGWPEGELTVEAAMLKVDVTLEGCGAEGGLTLGVLQTDDGLFIVGLGDQFTAASAATPAPLAQVQAVTEHLLAAIAAGDDDALVLTTEACAPLLGSAELCQRTFQELPDQPTLARYTEHLSSCEATPRLTLPIVALWLTDESGARFQALARLTTTDDGRPTPTEPITFAPGGP